MARVLVVDDSAAVRAGLMSLLGGTDDLTVVGTCADGADVVATALRLEPDVVLMDLLMPRMDGIEATAALLAARPRSRVLILSAAISGDMVCQAERAGAAGCLHKSAHPFDVLAAVRDVATGSHVWPDWAIRALRRNAPSARPPQPSPLGE